jgi:hypothetical protein
MEKTIIIKNTVSLLNLFLNNIEQIHADGCMENIETIINDQILFLEENRINIRRLITLKDFFPKFISNLIPSNIRNNIYNYIEHAELIQYTPNHHIYTYYNEPNINLYTLNGKLDFIYDSENITIIIYTDVKILKTIPFKEIIEKKISNMVNDIYIKMFQKIEEKYHAN